MKLKALKAAFPLTLPICVAFLFLGASYGLFMRSQGFSSLYPIFMSLLIFAGSLEFIGVSLLLSAFSPLSALLITLLVNGRHLFYGIAMLDKYKGTGLKKIYLIFGMCDESFSINCSTKVPDDIDKGWFYFFVTLLNHIYWVTGATLGALIGSYITFNTKGIEFVMTSLFVVIFLNQYESTKQHSSAFIGLICTALALFICGKDNFITLALLLILIVFTLFRGKIKYDNDNI